MDPTVKFDKVFNRWVLEEIYPTGKPEIDGELFAQKLKSANVRGFSTLVEWRLNTALRLGMPDLKWHKKREIDPNVLANVCVGPYKGVFENLPFGSEFLKTTFADAVSNQDFRKWCKKHNRIQMFRSVAPVVRHIILFELREPNKPVRRIHVDGFHCMMAIALNLYENCPLDYTNSKFFLYVADISGDARKVKAMEAFLKQGTGRDAERQI